MKNRARIVVPPTPPAIATARGGQNPPAKISGTKPPIVVRVVETKWRPVPKASWAIVDLPIRPDGCQNFDAVVDADADQAERSHNRHECQWVAEQPIRAHAKADREESAGAAAPVGP